jgi:hypothetical protein
MDEPLPTQPEFAEIAHSGGKITLSVRTLDGRRGYQVKYSGTSRHRVVLLELRVSISGDQVGGLEYNTVPPEGWAPVHLASDSEGRFGHECPLCKRYWRSDPWPTTCPYCGLRADGLAFLSKAQKLFFRQYATKLREALDAEEDGDHIIDMDAVADAAGKVTPKPPFYYAEESQQNKFVCNSCGAFNDILGKFGYCSSCATRNDMKELETKTIPQIRDRINAGGAYEASIKDAVAAFDIYTGQYIGQLVQLIPMTPRRKAHFEKTRFHNLTKVVEDLKSAFDIDLCVGIKAEDVEFATLRFRRRHVYEHLGGEADQKYIDESGDAVRLKQELHETQESAHRFAGIVMKLAVNLHKGFHEIFPPLNERIEAFVKRQRKG